MQVFPVDWNAIDTKDILDVLDRYCIHRFLIKETQCKIMFGIIKKCLLYF